MPRSKKVQAVEPQVEQQVAEQQPVEQPIALTKADYLKARATIKQFREEKRNRPKRQCTQRQLEALAKGRESNKRFQKKAAETK